MSIPELPTLLSNAPYEGGTYAQYDNDLPPPVMYNFYNPYRLQIILDCGEVMMTKQEFKDECDIHNILHQFSKTGIIEHINESEAQWLDLPDQMDFQQSLEIIQNASNAFESLPSAVREKYGNDPAKFLGALNDPSQKEYLTEVGILAPAWAKSPPPAEPPKAPPPASTTPPSGT